MTKDRIDKVAELRSESACLVLTLYCQNVDCAGREVVVKVKDHDRTLVAQLAKPQPCPLCGRPLKFHHVVTFAQYEAQDARNARCSVNTQMLPARHQQPIRAWLRVRRRPTATDAGGVVPSVSRANPNLRESEPYGQVTTTGEYSVM